MKMRKYVMCMSAAWVWLALMQNGNAGADSSVNWPQFRGPHASGVSEEPAPVTWDVGSGENIRWQTEIPGLGHACPIVWQERIYVASVVKPGSKPKLRLG